MKTARNYNLVLVTAPDLKTARKLARSALSARLAACVNLVPGIESHYWWQEKLERGSEILMIFKTNSRLLGRLERCIMAGHPYQTPEFLVLPINSGNARYLAWLEESVGAVR